MVVFTCGTCNESLRKNQVEMHYTQKCRRCEMLSCVDCGKEFWGDAYKEHVKCISEEEKYSGKNFVPRENANKGDKKQEMWLQQVEKAIEKTRNSKLKGLLLTIQDYPNIPRKKAKFENFVRNSIRIYDSKLVAEVWDILTSEMQKEKAKVVENGHSRDNKVDKALTESGDRDDQQKNLNKRERKEERRKKAMKKQKKDKHRSQSEETEEDETTENDKGRKKKRKHQELDEEEEEELHLSKKKKKRKHQEMNEEELQPSKTKKKKDETSENLNSSQVSVEEEEEKSNQKKQKFKFRWQETMVRLLKKKGEMSLKRMKKKIIDEYICQGGFVASENALLAKFDKKVHKIPLFKVHKDRVKLVE